MASSSSKFDLSSGSPDRPLYSSGQRPHAASSLDRSGSFRETIENTASASHGNLSRNSSSVGQAEVLNFFQCLPFGSKLLPLDHRSNRQGDLKRNLAVAIGISPDNSPPNLSKGKLVVPPSQEDLKRVRQGLQECSSKARDRVKLFDEALCLVNKFFPAVSTKKRSRSEVFTNDRSGLMLSSDRSMHGQGLGKVGLQNNSISVGFEHELQKSEERIKSSVPSKRRTSLADLKPEVRGHGSMRPSGPIDRDRELPKLANSVAQSDDRALPIGVDGWEKTKMKKKRSIIKPDAVSAAVSTKPIDAYRETKQGVQQRSLSNPRMRLNGDSHGIRSGFGTGKGEAIPQQIGLSSRASIPKVDGDGISIVGDKRDRAMNSDKERLNIRAVNKSNSRDDFNSSSPALNPKMNASVRGPRSNSGAAPKMVPVANRATPPHDWDATHCKTRPPAAAGANNRKRAASARSSSPPTDPYSPGQPPKSNRSSRRTNLGPSLSSNDEASPLDTVSDAVGNEAGLGFPRRFLIGSPKLKSDLPYSPSVSEGEDSVGVETKPRDRFKKSDELDEKSGHRIQKPPTLSSRKTKLASGEGHGDGIRKQGRTGRGFTTSRSALPLSRAKVGHEEAKQLRSTRTSSDKNESKAGRPSTRKLSDRKSYARNRHSSINVSADFLVGSDDGHEELLAAANAVVNPTYLSSESFWREKDPLLGIISDIDIDYLKQQESFLCASKMENLVRADTNDYGSVASVLGQTEAGAEGQSTTSLYERLLASLIPDDEAEYCINENGDLKADAYGSKHEVDGYVESNGFGYDCEAVPSTAQNGYMVTGGPSYHNHGNGNDMANILRTSGFGFDRPRNGLVAEQGFVPCITKPESSYGRMDMNEKLLMEMNSIGIFPEASPKPDQFESGGIDDEINKLMEKHQEQASKTKSMLDRLLMSAEKAKESQEKEFEQLALDKLVGLAYQKYMTCFGHGGRSSSNKMAKQAAIAFVKRTLERCKQFEITGRSCFSEPLFREIFQSGSSRISLARLADFTAEDHISEQPNGTEDTWLNRVKKRELLLDDVIGSSGVGNSIASPSGIRPLVSSTKGRRSERDREGKGGMSRAGTTKNGRSSVSNAKGERKSKAKPKQKTTQLSVSINGLVSGTSNQLKPQVSGPKSGTSSKEKVDFGLDTLEEPLDFSQLQLPGMDVLGSNDLGGQGEDLTSWLNMVDDDNLQDHDDFLGLDGLEIPMDDLSDLNMMV